MKNLVDFISESTNYDKWKSIHGSFNSNHLKQIGSNTKWHLSKLVKLLDKFDDEWGGPVEWEVKDNKLIFKNVDAKREWICDGKKWEEVRFESVKEDANDSQIQNLIKKHSKNTKDKKIFNAFIEFINDKKEDYDDIDDYIDFLNDEAYGDFFYELRYYGLSRIPEDYLEEMDFDGFVVDLINLLKK